jgi:hypothetical protein
MKGGQGKKCVAYWIESGIRAGSNQVAVGAGFISCPFQWPGTGKITVDVHTSYSVELAEIRILP